ncbi:MAG TPA: P63C domain-containing protein [Vicinamibacterales bacterium]
MAENNNSKQAKGGKARALSLTREERVAAAKAAAAARWSGDLPQATHDGVLELGGRTLVAAVLGNGKRLLSQGTFLQAIGRSRTPKAGTGGFSTVDTVPFFLQSEDLKPFISEELLMSTTPILFKLRNGQRTVGYDALLLPMVSEVYLNLRDDYVARGKTVPNRYAHIVAACDRLTRALARDGIRAMVDLATGYQADRAREDALKLIELYVAPALMPWTRKFPHEFFREVYRLLGWEYKPGSVKHPQYMGKFINKYIYDPFPPGVVEEMKRRLPKNENGNRKAKLWQTLTIDTGNPHLDRQITTVLTLMQIAPNKNVFEQHFSQLFSNQRSLPLAQRAALPQ